MSTSGLAIAKPPKQRRSRQRVSVIRLAAEEIILNEGMEACSIAALADKTGYPRTTIYMFYPSPLALFNDLAALHLHRMQQRLKEEAAYIRSANTWRVATQRLIKLTATYYQEHPVAAKLVLGPLTDSTLRAWEDTVMNLGRLMTAMLKSRGVKLEATNADIGALAVEYAAATLRFSYYVHGSITTAYVEAASEAIMSFVSRYIVSEVGQGSRLS